MANKQIKDLPVSIGFTGTDQLAYDSAGGVTYKVTGTEILNYVHSATNFTDLVGTPGAYTTAYSMYMVNSTTNGITESLITSDANGIIDLPATGSFQINSADINTGGTLSNVTYLDQANVFLTTNAFSGITTFDADLNLKTNTIQIGDGTDTTQEILSLDNTDTANPILEMNSSITGITTTAGLHLLTNSVGRSTSVHIEATEGPSQIIASTKHATSDAYLDIGYLQNGTITSGTRSLWSFRYKGTTSDLNINSYSDGVTTNRLDLNFSTGVFSVGTIDYETVIGSDDDIPNIKWVSDHADTKNYWSLAGGVITPKTSTDNINLPTGQYRFNSNVLPIDGNPEHWLIGTDHSKYTAITTALTNITDSARGKPYWLTLTNEEFTGNLDFATGTKEYISLDGEFTRLTGQISTYDNVSINVFELYKSGAGFSFYKGAGQTGHSYLKAAKVDTPTTLPGIVSNSGTIDAFIDWITTDQGFCLGTTAADQSASINAFINQMESTAGAAEASKLVASNDADSDISFFANKVVSDSAGTSYVFDLDNGNMSAYINKATDFDHLLDQEAGLSCLTFNQSEGVIAVSGGTAHISSGRHDGNINITGGTLYANILNHNSGSVSYTPGQVAGRIGNDFYAKTATYQLVAKARDAANEGGKWTFEGAGTYASWGIKSYQDHFTMACDVADDNYEVRIENVSAARTAKIYNDELSGTNGTVYVNAGYLTTVDPSDKSLKENIQLFNDNDMVSKFKQFALKNFNYTIDGSAKTSYIAQDIEAIEPRLVKESNMPVGYTIRENEEIDEKTGETKIVTNKKTKFEVRKGLNLDLMARYHEYVTIQLINRIEALEAKVL